MKHTVDSPPRRAAPPRLDKTCHMRTCRECQHPVAIVPGTAFPAECPNCGEPYEREDGIRGGAGRSADSLAACGQTIAWLLIVVGSVALATAILIRLCGDSPFLR